MATSLLTLTAQRVEPDSLINYLKFSGWSEDTSATGKWLVFHGYQDADGNPLEIVIPKDRSAYDYANYIAATLELLLAINNDDSLEDTVTRVRNHMSDVLSMRNVEKFYGSLPLELAAKQIRGLMTLVRGAVDLDKAVRSAAESNDAPLPYFASQPSDLANSMVRKVQFGHTFRGSFGYTIESPLEQIPMYREPQNVVLPLGRRVMERIVRGLVIAREAVAQRDIDMLIHGYMDGFNANMCSSILEMSDNSTALLEYKVLWSPAILASEDLRAVESISLDELGYKYVSEAENRLRALVQREPVTVRGYVTDIRTTDNPLSLEAQREITIYWANREEAGRPLRAVGITLKISADDYIIAHSSQKDWITVAVEGEARYTGKRWYLDNPRNLRFAYTQ